MCSTSMAHLNEAAVTGLVLAVLIEKLCLWRRSILESIKIIGEENERIANNG